MLNFITFGKKNWRKAKDPYDDLWTDDELILSSKYINYKAEGELLMFTEVEYLEEILGALIEGTLEDDVRVAFAEPDIEFELRIAKRLYSIPGKVIYREGYKDVDIDADFEEVFGHFRRQVPVKVDFVKTSPDTPATLKRNAKANFAIVFISDESQPPSVIMPEEGCAVVNFAKYTTGLKLPTDEEKYKRRCARAALKAFVLLCGGGSSRYPGHVAAAHTPQELDFAQDKLPIDIQDSVKKYLEAAGVTPMKRTIYRRAVQEGWAPQPTNDVQQAIWDEIRALPQKPLQIDYDPKKGK